VAFYSFHMDNSMLIQQQNIHVVRLLKNNIIEADKSSVFF